MCRQPPDDTPSLDTSFHDHEMAVDDEWTEADETASIVDVSGLNTWADCKAKARELMPDENETVIDNLADALHARLT